MTWFLSLLDIVSGFNMVWVKVMCASTHEKNIQLPSWLNMTYLGHMVALQDLIWDNHPLNHPQSWRVHSCQSTDHQTAHWSGTERSDQSSTDPRWDGWSLATLLLNLAKPGTTEGALYKGSKDYKQNAGYFFAAILNTKVILLICTSCVRVVWIWDYAKESIWMNKQTAGSTYCCTISPSLHWSSIQWL